MSETVSIKSFLNITEAECLTAYPEIEKNARELYTAANILAGRGIYSKAISLRILGAEEYIKALCIFFDAYGCNTRKIPKVKNIFSQHQSRHKITRDFLPVWLVVKHLITFRLTNSVPKNVGIIARSLLSAWTASHMHEWWKQANQFKNEGLYVDYQDGVISPSRFSLEDYQRAKRYTTEIASVFKALQIHLANLSTKELEEFRENFKIAEFDKLIEESLTRQ